MMESSSVQRIPTTDGSVIVATRRDLEQVPAWQRAFWGQRKDRRFYELVEDTILQDFDYRYFVFEDRAGRVRGVQPFFLLHQDLLQGATGRIKGAVDRVRDLLPHFLTMRTLMVGCAAGEGHLDPPSPQEAAWVAARLHEVLKRYARTARASMVVLKEFPASYRQALGPFSTNGYCRVPSLPSVRIPIPYANFEEYMSKALSKATRKDLRRKFRDTEGAGISMQVLTDVAPHVDEVYPLYLQVFERSKLHFEKLTKEYFCRLGRDMPEKTRFFVWRRDGRAIAFSVCMINGDEIHDEYVGMDYSLALDLHLYFYTLRDIMQWAMANGFKWYCSSGQGYEPKLRLKAELVPLDLYAAHTWPGVNLIMRRILPLLEPTRANKIIREFPNYDQVWGSR